MSFSAYCPIASLGRVRRILSEQGFGPSNFSVPLREGNEAATHAATHAWGPAAFRQAIKDLPIELGVIIHDNETGTNSTVSFAEMTTAATLDWSDPLDADNPWFVNPIMIGATRTRGGKNWESLLDFNVWMPPVGWREVVGIGELPDWVQPTGVHDVWNLNDEVNHNSKQWRSLIAANVWEPGSVGSGSLWLDITVVVPIIQPWVQPTGAHDAYQVGDRVTHDNPNDRDALWVYRSAIAANTTQPGRDGTFNRWWTPIERT